ncbi:hypothetical protein M407DRAFT_25018 [Tulasnella calospora MUT 4182]|uniref:Uncharacterized protein n=1 Tax=Tulasnella calospora MUT 4182 TaxID=1051891 RepID=A0A0C3QGT9_9AGAM|nr:hypothetical protein M407DRAFT_25018 [Tulasnella calospora MUT 4182]
MHQHRQIKQVVMINKDRHLDWCNIFGGRTLGTLWCLFFGIVIWIATLIFTIANLFHYVDNTFSHDDSKELEWYKPYQTHYPPKQIHLLHLFDKLGRPHEKWKQEFRPKLTIIGFEVDPQAMTITMPEEAHSLLATHLRGFTNIPPEKHHQCMLKEWQSMLGYANWALNTYPLLKPALQSSYDKIAGKMYAKAGVYMNLRVQKDLQWFVEKLDGLDRVHILEALDWDVKEADAVFICDVCQQGMGFWDMCGFITMDNITVGHEGFYVDAPTSLPATNILYCESLSIILALATLAQNPNPPYRVMIYNDNLGTVASLTACESELRGRTPNPFITSNVQLTSFLTQRSPCSYSLMPNNMSNTSRLTIHSGQNFISNSTSP